MAGTGVEMNNQLKYSIGTKVRKWFEGNGWFTGKAVSHNGRYYKVVYDDGDSEEYDDNEMSKIVLSQDLENVEIGSRVAVYRTVEDQYYEATVTRERIDKKPLYLESDGGECQWVNLFDEQFILLEERRIRLAQQAGDSSAPVAAKSDNTKRSLGDITIGSQIAVYRPSTSQYHDATVTRSSENDGDSKCFYCEFFSGGGEWIDLSQRDFIPLEKKKSNNNVALQDEKINAQQDLPAMPEAAHDKSEMISPPSPKEEVSVVTPKMEDEDKTDNQSILPKRARRFPFARGRAPSPAEGIGIGSHVAIFDEEENQYRQALVTRKRYIKKPYFLEYSNGGCEWVDFSRHKFVVLEKGAHTISGHTRKRKVQDDATKEEASTDGAVMALEEQNPKESKRHRTEINTVKPEPTKEKQASKGKWGNKKQIESLGMQSTASGEAIDKSNKVESSASKKKGSIKATGNDAESKGNTKQTGSLGVQSTVREIAEKSKPKYDIGTKVKKYFRGHGWHNGQVKSFNGWYYRVRYEDGDEEENNKEDLSAIILPPELEKVEVGSRVAVQWPTDKTFYEATIVDEQQTRKKPYLVEYDTGHYEWLDLRTVEFCLLEGGARRQSSTAVEDESDEAEDHEDSDSGA